MFFKALVAILAVAAVAVVLLGYRQQRFESMHEMAKLHSQINNSRQEIWETQVRIAGRLQPERLAKSIERSKLALQPAVPGWTSPETRMVSAKGRNNPVPND